MSFSQAGGRERISEIPPGLGAQYIVPRKAQFYKADFTLIKAQLQEAPLENTGSGIIFFLPAPGGHFEAYEIWKYHVMEEGLRNLFPEIGTYLGRSAVVPSRLVRIDHTYQGFHARVTGSGGTRQIDPVIHLNTEYYQVYYKEDLINNKPFECGTLEIELPNEMNHIPKTILQNGTQFKTYRLALAATGEYTVFH